MYTVLCLWHALWYTWGNHPDSQFAPPITCDINITASHRYDTTRTAPIINITFHLTYIVSTKFNSCVGNYRSKRRCTQYCANLHPKKRDRIKHNGLCEETFTLLYGNISVSPYKFIPFFNLNERTVSFVTDDLTVEVHVYTWIHVKVVECCLCSIACRLKFSEELRDTISCISVTQMGSHDSGYFRWVSPISEEEARKLHAFTEFEGSFTFVEFTDVGWPERVWCNRE